MRPVEFDVEVEVESLRAAKTSAVVVAGIFLPLSTIHLVVKDTAVERYAIWTSSLSSGMGRQLAACSCSYAYAQIAA